MFRKKKQVKKEAFYFKSSQERIKPQKIEDNLYACKQYDNELTGNILECMVAYYYNDFHYPYAFVEGNTIKTFRTTSFNEVLEVAYNNRSTFTINTFLDRYSEQERNLIFCILNDMGIEVFDRF